MFPVRNSSSQVFLVMGLLTLQASPRAPQPTSEKLALTGRGEVVYPHWTLSPSTSQVPFPELGLSVFISFVLTSSPQELSLLQPCLWASGTAGFLKQTGSDEGESTAHPKVGEAARNPWCVRCCLLQEWRTALLATQGASSLPSTGAHRPWLLLPREGQPEAAGRRL